MYCHTIIHLIYKLCTHLSQWLPQGGQVGATPLSQVVQRGPRLAPSPLLLVVSVVYSHRHRFGRVVAEAGDGGLVSGG